MTTWAIIPVKPLRYGKSRLSRILSPDERARLTTKMLSRTLDTLNQVPAIFRSLVISRDPAALKIARQHDAYTYGEGERQGLNQALTRAAHIAAAQEATGVLVVPADLPLVTREDIEMMLAGVAPTMNGARVNGYHQPRTISICPDRYEDGTNALYVSPPTGFQFRYGEGSFHKHLEEAEAIGMNSRIVHAPGLKFDLDTEDDWYTFRALNGEPVPVSLAC